MEKIKRPRVVDSLSIKVPTGCGNAYLTTTYVDGKIIECFMHLGKAGGCAIAQGEALLRSISVGLRYGIPVEEYIEQLQNIGCPNPAFTPNGHIRSCPDAVAKVLKEFGTKPAAIPVEAPKSEEEQAKEVMEQQAKERERLES